MLETRLPWCPKRGSLSLAWYLVRNPTLRLPLEKNPETPPSSRDEGIPFPPWPRAQSRFLSPNSTGGVATFRPLCVLQQIPVTTTEENGGLCLHSRLGLTPWVSLECNPEICVAPSEEHWLLDTSLDEVYLPRSHSRAIPSFPSKLEWNIGLPWANKRGILNSQS